MLDKLKKWFGVVAVTSLAACANINTIDRTTAIPGGLKDSDSRVHGLGKAVHLDIQQRLLVVNAMGEFCAEPSPDALAAFAAAVGIGASEPTTGALAAALSGQSSAAAVGLRTQSITLMRDAMFRMCEAYANGQIGPAQVATLLGRSQDLTAVILAVEQLTGPVVAAQPAIDSSAEATATASALANADQVALVGRRLDRDRERSAEADQAVMVLQTAFNEAEAAHARAEGELAALRTMAETPETPAPAAPTVLVENNVSASAQPAMPAPAAPAPVASTPVAPAPDPELVGQIEQKEAEVAALAQERDKANAALMTAQAEAKRRKEVLMQTEELYQTLLEKQDSAIADVATATSSRTQFATPAAGSKLPPEAAEEVAKAVKEMVIAVINKDYVLESCMSIITTHDLTDKDIRPKCIELVTTLLDAREKITVDRLQRMGIY